MEPLRPISGSVVGWPSASRAQPRGIGLPSRACFMTSLFAIVLALWSIRKAGSPSAPGTAIETGLVPTIGLAPPEGAIEAGADADKVLTRIQNDLAVEDFSAVTPESLAALISMETGGELSATQAKTVLADMAAGEHDGDPRAIAAAHGFEAMDTGELESMLDELIAQHPAEWERFCDPDQRKKMQGFFTGQIMKATKGQADGRAVAELLGRKAAG